MAIPDYQTLMRPVLEKGRHGEVKISAVIQEITDDLDLTESEREQMLPSGKQTVIANRIHWAKTYLKQAGLVSSPRRAHYVITGRGIAALSDPKTPIDNALLKNFDEFLEFQGKGKDPEQSDQNETDASELSISEEKATPDEELRIAHEKINKSLASDLLERVRSASPAFFEDLLVSLFVAMGYGGSSAEAGRALGRSGDDGVDGVIDQDPLGVDQIYLQAKRYAEGNNVGSGAIRDFYGALSLKRAQKGIFVTTSAFSSSAVQTAQGLGNRIVLINGAQLSRLMLKYNIGCRDEDVLHLKRVDEDFFDDLT